MNEPSVSVPPGHFANGFDYFCAFCGNFYSAQVKDQLGEDGAILYSPCCGDDELVETIEELLEYCSMNVVDPVNFFSAFPLDEPIPQSLTGATPREVKTITSTVINWNREKRPVTIEDVAVSNSLSWKIVQRVFRELHISETRNAA